MYMLWGEGIRIKSSAYTLWTSYPINNTWSQVHFSLVAQSWPTLCNPMDYSMSAFPVHHQLLELAQTHVLWVSDAIQSPHPLLPPSPLALKILVWFQNQICSIRYIERHLASILGWRTLHHVLSSPFSNNLQFFMFFSSHFLSLSCIQNASSFFFIAA